MSQKFVNILDLQLLNLVLLKAPNNHSGRNLYESNLGTVLERTRSI
jgi:hypothetical protein